MEDFFTKLTKEQELNLLADVLKDHLDLNNENAILKTLNICSKITNSNNLKLIDLAKAQNSFNKRIKEDVHWLKLINYKDKEDVKELLQEKKKRNPEYKYIGVLIKLEHELKTK